MLVRRWFEFVTGIVAALAVGEVAYPAPADRADGYCGIWYMNQSTGDEYHYKYSGGFATYPQQHEPIAIYSRAANKTFFCYGGATGKPKELASMVSYFDHATGQVPRPRVVLVKKTDDAHENPTLQIDDAGHLWVFCNSHGPANNSYIFRSVAPYSIDEFEQITRTNFSYSEPWFVPEKGYLFLHTRYKNGRRLLHWMTSPDGREWSTPTLLAAVEMGHYQISNRRGGRVATAFNYHPNRGGLNARTNLYYLETADMGKTWTTAAGKIVATPITEKHNDALVFDYEAEHKLVYLKDINFDAAGRPVILYLTSGGYAPGPASGPREWFTAHWTGDSWQRRAFTSSDHNYDFGPLYNEDGLWRIIAPTAPGPQPFGAGGEMVMWKSRDEGRTWTKVKQLTRDSKMNTRTLVGRSMRSRSFTHCGPTAIRSNAPTRGCISPIARGAMCGDFPRTWTASSPCQKSCGKEISHGALQPAGDPVHCRRLTCVGGRRPAFWLPTNREPGANPGRPRRCNRAKREAFSKCHCSADSCLVAEATRPSIEMSEKACFRAPLGSQKTYQRVACGWPRGTAAASVHHWDCGLALCRPAGWCAR